MGSYPLSSQAPIYVEVELDCDNIVQLLVDYNLLMKFMVSLGRGNYSIADLTRGNKGNPEITLVQF